MERTGCPAQSSRQEDPIPWNKTLRSVSPSDLCSEGFSCFKAHLLLEMGDLKPKAANPGIHTDWSHLLQALEVIPSSGGEKGKWLQGRKVCVGPPKATLNCTATPGKEIVVSSVSSLQIACLHRWQEATTCFLTSKANFRKSSRKLVWWQKEHIAECVWKESSAFLINTSTRTGSEPLSGSHSHISFAKFHYS